MSSSFVSQFDQKLLDASTSKEVSPKEALAGKKYVMLYFSAHWCPPCRRFTPKLIELYKKLKSKHEVELIFCSLDNDKKEYEEYISNMPWLCMPFHAPQTPLMGRKYGARGIPHLVVCDGADGSVITVEGVSKATIDENGDSFPWKPKTFGQLWPEKVLLNAKEDGDDDGKMKFVESSTFKDKYLMLYFSAAWCPPCRNFTPKLAKFYTKLKSQRDDFELVFVSSDRDEEAFDDYFKKKMPFCALPYEYRETKEALSKSFGVMGIPTLVMLGPQNAEDGSRDMINNNIAFYVEQEAFDEFPYHRKNYGDMDYATFDLNEEKALVVFAENCDDGDQDDIKGIMKEVGSKLKDQKSDLQLLWVMSSSRVSKQIRSLAKLPEVEKAEDPTMLILDIPDQGGYYKSDETDLTVENMMEFIETPGKRLQLGE